MTDKYFIFLEQPLLVNVLTILKSITLNQSIRPAMEFHKELKAKFHVVRRDTGEVC